MNTLRTQLLALFAAASLFASLARADETTYAKILKERDSVLAQIVAQHEGTFAIGTTGDEALVAAGLALWSFRRDTAPLRAEKIKQQELIVTVFEKKFAGVKSGMATGLLTSGDLLLARDALLQAQQLLEELKLEAKSAVYTPGRTLT